jgi:hypothetical protein
MGYSDPWKQKASTAAHYAKAKGMVAIFWADREPPGHNPVKPRDVSTTTDIARAPDAGQGLIGIYEAGAETQEIYDDLLEAVAEAGKEAEGAGASGDPYKSASTARASEAEQKRRERLFRQSQAVTEDPQQPSEEEAEEERPVPDPAGEPAAEDPPADSHVSTAINSGATDKSPEPEHEETSVADQTDHQAEDLPEGVDPKAINHARALLYREWVNQHEQGKTGHRALYGWLIKQLDEVAG